MTVSDLAGSRPAETSTSILSAVGVLIVALGVDDVVAAAIVGLIGQVPAIITGIVEYRRRRS